MHFVFVQSNRVVVFCIRFSVHFFFRIENKQYFQLSTSISKPKNLLLSSCGDYIFAGQKKRETISFKRPEPAERRKKQKKKKHQEIVVQQYDFREMTDSVE